MRETQATHDDARNENDLIGKHIFNESMYGGLGVIVDVKTVSNLKGDTKRVFVTKSGPDASPTNRDVESVFDALDTDAYDAYDVDEIFDDWSAEDFGL